MQARQIWLGKIAARVISGVAKRNFGERRSDVRDNLSGLEILCGSIAAFRARMASMATRPCSAIKVFHLALPHPMLASAGTVHRQCAFDHVLYTACARVTLAGIRHIHQQGDVEIAVSNMAKDRSEQSALLRDRAGSQATHSASREIGTQTSVANDCAPGTQARPPNRRRAAPATASSGPRPWWPIRRARRRIPARSPRNARLFLHTRFGAVEFKQSIGSRGTSTWNRDCPPGPGPRQALDPRHRNA